jgi:hypothetical protein
MAGKIKKIKRTEDDAATVANKPTMAGKNTGKCSLGVQSWRAGADEANGGRAS